MRHIAVKSLDDCTEFRQTLQAQPPAFVHATVLLLLALIGSAVGWGALTQANLVVRAPGRLRPEVPPVSVFVPEPGQRPGYTIGREVREVFYREGDAVQEGQQLIRLDTYRVDREIERITNELADLRAERQRAILRSPIDGVVITAEVNPGDALKHGEPVVQVAREKTLYFKAAVPSGDVGHLKSGMAARIRLDAYDYQRYGTVPGEVVRVSTDSRAVEAGARQQLAYEVRVRPRRETLNDGNLEVPVQLGLTGTAEIITDRRSILAILLQKIRRTISL